MMIAYPFLAFGLCLFGCAALALSQPVHFRRVSGQHIRSLHAVRRLRIMGWTLILMVFVVCIAWAGISFAALLWPLITAFSTLVVALCLAYRPSLMSALVGRSSQDS